MKFIKKIYENYLKGFFTKKYWVAEFPYPDVCYNCRHMTCEGCDLAINKNI